MMDEEAKEAFLAMPLDQQLLAIIDSMTFIRLQLAKLDRRMNDLETDLRLHREEQLKQNDR